MPPAEPRNSIPTSCDIPCDAALRDPIHSVRVTLGYRALGLLDDEELAWFWIGKHAEYDRLLENL